MSYLSQPASKISYGIVEIGNNIDVDEDGIISIPQSVASTASVVFDKISAATSLTLDSKSVITTVTPTSGPGISLSVVTSTGPTAGFTITNTGVISNISGDGISVSAPTGNVTVTNTGVLSLTAGAGITLSGSTGNITISSVGADLISVYGTSTNYTATALDEYIGVDSVAAVTITLPAGVSGRIYTIKDEHGQGSGKITIQPQSGELVDGKTNYVISVPYQSISVVFRAGQWRII